jgi:N6-adenosine-specific RNA methylase IME4
MGCGYWWSGNAEPCLLGTRGKRKRLHQGLINVIEAPRRKHSQKPDEVYEKIERMFEGPYIELFAWQRRDGWKAWGNEV